MNGLAGKKGQSDIVVIWYITERGGEGITSNADVKITGDYDQQIRWRTSGDEGRIYWNDQDMNHLL